jgi:hypothetical protein
MSPRTRTVVWAVAISAATILLFIFHRERWAEALGAAAGVWAIADAIQKPASTLSKCLLILGFSLWIIELVFGAAFNMFPQTSSTVGLLFLCGCCLVFAGNQMRLNQRAQPPPDQVPQP